MRIQNKRWLWLILLLVCGGQAALAGPFDNWGWKMQITFAGYNPPGGGTLTNFPELVVLSTNISSFSYGNFLSGSNADLRFTDSTGTTPLNYEIDSWNTNGNSYVWVQVPTIASASDCIWAYWGRGGTNAAPCTTNGATWSNGYVAVWHLANGTTLNVADSTANGKNGTAYNMSAGTGKIGGGGSFNGLNATTTGGYIQTPVVSSMNNSVTLSAWATTTLNTQDGQGILYNGSDNDGNGYGMFVNQESATSGHLWFLYGALAWWDTGTIISGNIWHHIVATLSADGKTATVYVDGASIGSHTFATAPNAPSGETDIGRDNYIVGHSTVHRYFYGSIDEPRIAGTIHSCPKQRFES